METEIRINFIAINQFQVENGISKFNSFENNSSCFELNLSSMFA